MKLTTQTGSENYVASVVKIKEILPIEGADKIGKVFINGNTVIVSKELDLSKPVVYFTALSQLSEDLCKKTNSYTDSEMNEDKTKRGFIEKSRRVKAIKLRGEISNGLILPIEYFPEGLKVGDEFTHIDGVEYVIKYKAPITQTDPLTKKDTKRNNKIKRFNRMIEGQFNFHESTSHLVKNLHRFIPETVVSITDKLHGTSIVVNNCLVKRELTLKERIAKWFGINVHDTYYDVIYSSRSVIKNSTINKEKGGGFYGEDVWGVVKKEVEHLLPKGISLYGEIVGYTPSGSAIQKKYDYFCKEREYKFIVYRITQTNVDGKVTEFTPTQIKNFCDERGLKHSEYIKYFGQLSNFLPIKEDEDLELWRIRLYEYLCELYTEKDCTLCSNKVPEEGVVIRIEDGKNEYNAFKLKSQRFILGEVAEQDKGETNIEDNESENN